MKNSKYATYKEAQEAAIKLGITDSKEYLKRLEEDPKLPSSPDRLHKNSGWVSWDKFLNK
jgi:hypothetical protein